MWRAYAGCGYDMNADMDPASQVRTDVRTRAYAEVSAGWKQVHPSPIIVTNITHQMRDRISPVLYGHRRAKSTARLVVAARSTGEFRWLIASVGICTLPWAGNQGCNHLLRIHCGKLRPLRLQFPHVDGGQFESDGKHDAANTFPLIASTHREVHPLFET